MRILHTSDWHLGVSAEQSPREEEHVLFLDWLYEELASREIEVLVHGGDVFHHVQPSARSQTLYYQFLARCVSLPKLRQIVIVGGNHDSASRLDAPSELLDALEVRVVGGLFKDDESWDRCICPIVDDDGNVELVILAVPYIHESRLGIRTTGKNAYEIREELVQAFRYVYTYLADLAEQRFGNVPMMTTGHLTCYPEQVTEIEGGFHTPLHQIESLGSLPPEIFDERYCYIALGHIHKMMQIGDSNAWYAGSPIPTDIIEARTPCYVMQVDIDTQAHFANVTKVVVPNWRPILELEGPPDEVLEAIRNLEWEEPLAPYIYVDLHVEAPMYDGMNRVAEVLQTFDKKRRPRIVRLKETLMRPDDVHPVLETFERKPLIELSPTEVFEKIYHLRHEQPPTKSILSAFSSLLQEEDVA
jgi:exonuclease SbcD